MAVTPPTKGLRIRQNVTNELLRLFQVKFEFVSLSRASVAVTLVVGVPWPRTARSLPAVVLPGSCADLDPSVRASGPVGSCSKCFGEVVTDFLFHPFPVNTPVRSEDG